MSITQSLNRRSILPLDSLMLDIDAENVIGNVALDASLFGNNGIINGGVSVVDGIGGGKAFLFDGSTGYINFGNILGFERTDAFSVSCWVKYNSTSNDKTIFSKLMSATPYTGYEFYVNHTDGNYITYIMNTHQSNSLSTIVSAAPAATWNHVVFAYDGSSLAGNLKIYKNCVLTEASTIVCNSLSASIQNTVNFLIGMRNGLAFPFSGYIQNFKMFNKELNPQEVRMLYEECRPSEIILYSNESVGNTSNPTVVQVTFTPISIPNLESFIDKGYLKIDIKCTNYLNLKKYGENSSIELGSGLYADKEEWHLDNIAINYLITDAYKTFYFPLNNFGKFSDFNSLTIQRIRVYFYYTTGTGQVSWKNASIIL